MTTRDATHVGAWYGCSATHFARRIPYCLRGDGGWYAICGSRVRGPLSCLAAALEASDRMLADATKEKSLP